MNVGLAVFVKSPEFSEVKTRIARVLGEAKALEIYELCLRLTQSRIESICSESRIAITPYWAVAEEAAMNLARWSSFDNIYQGAGGLGARMAKVHGELLKKHDACLLMGADSPLFPIQDFFAGVEHLSKGSRSAFVGPTEDGGFYVWGSREALPGAFWESVEYGVSSTLADFLSRLPLGIDLLSLATHWDIDTPEDLAHFNCESEKGYGTCES